MKSMYQSQDSKRDDDREENNLSPLRTKGMDGRRIVIVIFSVATCQSDHVPIHSLADRVRHHTVYSYVCGATTVVTSLVCGTLSPFAIFIHPCIVITCYARCRMPACRESK